MGTNMYLYQKARETYYQDLVREMEKKRVLARLPRQRWSMSRCTVGKLGMLLLRLGSRLKQFEQSHTALDRKDEVPLVSTKERSLYVKAKNQDEEKR